MVGRAKVTTIPVVSPLNPRWPTESGRASERETDRQVNLLPVMVQARRNREQCVASKCIFKLAPQPPPPPPPLCQSSAPTCRQLLISHRRQTRAIAPLELVACGRSGDKKISTHFLRERLRRIGWPSGQLLQLRPSSRCWKPAKLCPPNQADTNWPAENKRLPWQLISSAATCNDRRRHR